MGVGSYECACESEVKMGVKIEQGNPCAVEDACGPSQGHAWCVEEAGWSRGLRGVISPTA